eukprot:m.192430 g.192430  ORF g.192430 m.192430 type:complete len:72 (-) comp15654_c0_seq3:142-357(-)
MYIRTTKKTTQYKKLISLHQHCFQLCSSSMQLASAPDTQEYFSKESPLCNNELSAVTTKADKTARSILFFS